jgi:signal transduction histidine kinase/CheY-like chemotaxis protein/HPt (histidine-containing phosphotransfer) domain-containing protein
MNFLKVCKSFLPAAAIILLLATCGAEAIPHTGPFFVSLDEYTAYIKEGFDRSDTVAPPDLSSGNWLAVAPRTGARKTAPLAINLSGLPGNPRRIFLSPWAERDREYTILIPFTLTEEQFALTAANSDFSPGLYLASLGENWEIFLNGSTIKSEVHLDAEGQIRSHRSWRSIFFQFDKSLLVPGSNTLALRIIGGPDNSSTGMFYTAPYYIGEYDHIAQNSDESVVLILCGFYIFMGVYHLLLFFGRLKERYNLYYSILSVLIGIYLLLRTGVVHKFIPDSNITFRIEYGIFIMLIPILAAFLEDLNFKKVRPAVKIYGALYLLLALTQGIFSLPYGDDVLTVWRISAVGGLAYVFGYDVIYTLFKLSQGKRKAGEHISVFRVMRVLIVETPQGNILAAALVLILMGIPDLINYIISRNGLLRYSQYGFLLFTIATTFILVRRFSALFTQLDYMNSVLEITNVNLENTVRDRTRELEQQTLRAESASRAKSAFLARMSHEIRTPMNAVIGMSELALREETSPELMVDYVNDIKQAGINLLAIINDILDFSKIEAGNLEITPVSYSLSSLINDVVNLVRVRIMEKGLMFLVNLDASLPNNIKGDEVRVRQILLNLLSNAAKYTQQGYVRFTVSGTRTAAETLTLCFDVADSGIGIKPEDMGHLFGDFVRIDHERNKAVEGTGLGLAITRNLCRMMGGDVLVSSEYDKGSVFSARIIQTFLEEKKIAVVEKPGTKGSLLFYEPPVYAESIRMTLINLQVPVTVCTREETFFRELEEGFYGFAFVSEEFAEESVRRVKALSLKTTVVLLEDFRQPVTFAGDILRLPMPTYAVPVANLLNGMALTERRTSGRVRFIAPRAYVLLVDDIVTNLKVAEGLLALYQIRIDTASSGPEAVEMVQIHEYDIIFMDHMMPGMDGVEAVRIIRALGSRFRDLPIVALTANVVSGMQEMFLENGFNDCLAKPIEMSRLSDVLKTWIPAEKRDSAPDIVPSWREAEAGNVLVERIEQVEKVEKTEVPPARPAAPPAPELPPPAHGFLIEGVDIDRGIVMTGGSEDIYREVLDIYRQDVEQRLDAFRQPPDSEGLALFTTQVHALKSASASIGATALSEEAALLEGAGRREDMEFITTRLDHFRAALEAIIEGIRKALGTSA